MKRETIDQNSIQLSHNVAAILNLPPAAADAYLNTDVVQLTKSANGKKQLIIGRARLERRGKTTREQKIYLARQV